jgi:hypothetical protein
LLRVAMTASFRVGVLLDVPVGVLVRS